METKKKKKKSKKKRKGEVKEIQLENPIKKRKAETEPIPIQEKKKKTKKKTKLKKEQPEKDKEKKSKKKKKKKEKGTDGASEIQEEQKKVKKIKQKKKEEKRKKKGKKIEDGDEVREEKGTEEEKGEEKEEELGLMDVYGEEDREQEQGVQEVGKEKEAEVESAPFVLGGATRVFLGNLTFKITEEIIKTTFKDCGKVLAVQFLTDKETQKFYGSAFATFASEAAAKKALQMSGQKVMGRPIKIGLAKQSKGKSGHHAKPLSDRPEDCRTVFIGNLSFEIDEDTVRITFQECGQIKSVRWVEKNGEFSGCGFVEFDSSEAVDEAVKLNGTVVMGRTMRVNYGPDRALSNPKEEQW